MSARHALAKPWANYFNWDCNFHAKTFDWNQQMCLASIHCPGGHVIICGVIWVQDGNNLHRVWVEGSQRPGLASFVCASSHQPHCGRCRCVSCVGLQIGVIRAALINGVHSWSTEHAGEGLQSDLIKHWLSWPTWTQDSLIAENTLLKYFLKVEVCFLQWLYQKQYKVSNSFQVQFIDFSATAIKMSLACQRRTCCRCTSVVIFNLHFPLTL